MSGAQRRLVLLACILGAAAIVWGATRYSLRPRALTSSPQDSGPARAPAVVRASPPVLPMRDPFQYGEPAPSSTPGALHVGSALVAAPSPAAPTTRAPLRVTGLVRKADATRALVVVDGELLVVGVGQRAGSYRLTSIDPDVGVTFEGPGGPLVIPLPD